MFKNQLYSNIDIENNINFNVNRIPFISNVLDPRIVCIPKGFANELHHHAHETVIFILSGSGEVIINDDHITIKPNDVIFIPRWFKHQTKNTGNNDLTYFAVTDYGLTKCLPQNTEEIYRLNPKNVSA